jgi:hypothetical protein
MKTSTRIINFDAVDYMHTMPIYADQLERFLLRGGVLAWGVVPNSERIESDSTDLVRARLRDGLDALTEVGIERASLTERVILTPACGCAGISVEQAGKVYSILSDLDASSSDLFLDI